jgi:type IV pilus assembly protein PilY1
MKRDSFIRKAAYFRALCSTILLSMMLPLPANAGFVSLATSPLADATAGTVKPNIMFVLDDSGSMGWDFLPDWANSGSAYLFNNAGWNGVAYNPAVRYVAPTMFNSDGTLNTTLYPSMTGDSAAAGANVSVAMPNWQKVKFDGYGKQFNSGSDCPDGSGGSVCNLDNPASRPIFYTFIAGEYCTLPDLKTCHVQAAADATYPYPATLRWCTSSGMTNCRKTHSDATYTYARYPKPRVASFKINSVSGTPSVDGITVNGVQIMRGSVSASSASVLAGLVRDEINACNTRQLAIVV